MADFFSWDEADFADHARRLFIEFERESSSSAPDRTGDCRPPVDVLETAQAIEVVADLPGVPAEAVRVAIRQNTLLIVGTKSAGTIESTSRFHLAERDFGRFARAVRLDGAIDASRVRATVRDGQLRVVLPRLADPRGEVMLVPVERG